MDEQGKLDLLKASPFLQGLQEEQILKLLDVSSVENFPPNGVIFEEGEETNDAFIVLEGEVGAFKWDEEHGAQILLGKVGKGGAFGEISFMDGSQRSATIKATKATSVLKIARSKITSAEMLSTLLSNIATININRLKAANATYVKNLQESRHGLQYRLELATILIYQTFILGASIILTLLVFGGSSDYFPWLIAFFPSVLLIRSSNNRLASHGVNLKNWKGVLLGSAIVIASILVFVYLLPSYHWQLKDSPLLTEKRLSHWFVVILYCCSQEFIARGVMQTSLQSLIQDVSGYRTILLNAALLFILFLPQGMTIASSILVISLPLGLLYFRQKSLLGVVLVHLLLIALGIIAV